MTLRPLPGRPDVLHETDSCFACGEAVSWQNGDPIQTTCRRCGEPLVFNRDDPKLPVEEIDPEE